MGGHGTTITTPWPKVKANDKQNWKTVWPELKVHAEVDPLQEAADYYLCEGIAYGAFVQIKPFALPDEVAVRRAAEVLGLSLEEIRVREHRVDDFMKNDPRHKMTDFIQQAEERMKAQVERLDPVFTSYVHMACGGELRHHRAIGGVNLSGGRSVAWANWKNVIDEYGFDALLTAAKLFREFGNGAYGSEKWAVAAELLHQRISGTLGPDEFSNKKLFVDRVFTLEHNGGCFLNKLGWANKRKYSSSKNARQYNIGHMRYMLDYHHSNPPDIMNLYHFASPPVQTLTSDYMKIALAHDLQIQGAWNQVISNAHQEKLEGLKGVMAEEQALTSTHYHDGDEVFVAGGLESIATKLENGYVYWDSAANPIKVRVAVNIVHVASGTVIDVVETTKNFNSVEELAMGGIIYPKMMTKNAYPGVGTDESEYSINKIVVEVNNKQAMSVYVSTDPVLKGIHCNSLAYNTLIVNNAIAEAGIEVYDDEYETNAEDDD